MLKSYWDHSGKPSVFIVTEDGKEIYRGPYKDSSKLYSTKKNKCPLCDEPRIEFQKTIYTDINGIDSVVESCNWCGSTYLSECLDRCSSSPKKS